MIDVKRTRTRILSLAYSGALTSVKTMMTGNDELDALHKRIKKFEQVNESEKIIDVPEYWNWSRLGYVTNNHGQTTPDSTFCYVDVGTLDNEHQRLSKNENVIEAKDAPSRAKKVIAKGDVLYSTVRPYLHNICIIDREFTYTPIASTAFCVMAPNKAVLDTDYLFYWLLTDEFDAFANGNPSKGTLYPAIGEKALLHGVIPIPPLEEQRQISLLISQAFAELSRIESAQTLYQNDLQILKQKIVDYGISGNLTQRHPADSDVHELLCAIRSEKMDLTNAGFIKKGKQLPKIDDDEKPFDIPPNWEWIRWGDLSFQIQYGYNAPGKETGRIRMVRITDIQNNAVNWDQVPYCDISEEEIGKYLLHPGNILFARTGATVGKSYLVTCLPEESVFAGYLIRTSFSEKLESRYMKYFMESGLYWKQLRQGTTATAQPNCNAQTLSKMIVPLPPIEEQRRIADRIDELLKALPE